MRPKRTAFLSFLIFFYSASLLQAQQKPVSSHLQVYRITKNNKGNEVANRVKSTTPGDTLEYRLTYINNKNNAIRNLQPVLPVPAGLQYLGGTAQPVISEASLQPQGHTFQSLPITRQVTNKNGQKVPQKVPPRDYKRIRWAVPSLAAQDSVTLQARFWVIKKGNTL